MDKNIFMLDDETDILELVALHLKKANFKPTTFDKVSDFWRGLYVTTPNLIILDLMLPGSDGFEICRQLKSKDEFKHIPILMLTAKDNDMDKVLGLELGADDYLTKPFSPRELIARIKAILRRSSSVDLPSIIEFANQIKINLNTYETWVNDRKIELTSTEFRILKLLIEKNGWVLSRKQILKHLWGNDKIVIERTVDVHIKNIREKLGYVGKLIKNLRGIGYKLEAKAI